VSTGEEARVRIDTLELRNFRGYEREIFSFVPGMNLLIGPNASGKTTVLEGLSIALGSFFLGINGVDGRSIHGSDIRLKAFHGGDVPNFEEQYPVEVSAAGEVFGKKITWSRGLSGKENRTTTKDASAIKAIAQGADADMRKEGDLILPLLRYYGNGRLWLEPRETEKEASLTSKGLTSRIMGYYLALDPRCSPRDLMKWLYRQEMILFKERKSTAALELVQRAIARCMEGASKIDFDPKRGEMTIAFAEGQELPFSALSDGQRGIAALVGDLAMRSAQLNPQLGAEAPAETPGVVLIDEVDLYLHPKWQRSILSNLASIFPKLQFICTTHSPQVIGEIGPERILNLAGRRPDQSFGLSSNTVLSEVMGAEERDPVTLALFKKAYSFIAEDDYASARSQIEEIMKRQGGNDQETVRLETMIGNLESLDGEGGQ
jgi:predicted ATP-binding protein involved in virulence